MKHEAFFGFAFEAFEALHVVAGAERVVVTKAWVSPRVKMALSPYVRGRTCADFDPDVWRASSKSAGIGAVCVSFPELLRGRCVRAEFS